MEESAIAPHTMEELLEELTGESKRKWAVALLAFLLGAAVVVAVIRYRGRATLDAVGERSANEPATEDGLYNSPSKSSAWSVKRAQLARTDAAMRGRVGRLGSRLHSPQHSKPE